MKKRNFEEFISLAKKRYVLLVLMMFIVSMSGIVVFCYIVILSIAQLFHLDVDIILFKNHSYDINILIAVIWLAIAITSWIRLLHNSKLFVQGELDYVFGENIPENK